VRELGDFDPAAFIRAIARERTVSKERQKLKGAGLVAAVMVYAGALSIVYGSYFIGHRNPGVESKKRMEVTLLAAPPVIAVKRWWSNKQEAAESVKLASNPSSNRSPKRSKPDLNRARSISYSPSHPAEMPRHGAPLNRAPVGRHWNSGGTGADAARRRFGRRAPARVADHNAVFSVGSVTVKPRILGRPFPAHG
jgi:hypothetical protein